MVLLAEGKEEEEGLDGDEYFAVLPLFCSVVASIGVVVIRLMKSISLSPGRCSNGEEDVVLLLPWLFSFEE